MQFRAEVNTNQQGIKTDLKQQEISRLILLCNAKMAYMDVVPFDGRHFYLFSLLFTSY